MLCLFAKAIHFGARPSVGEDLARLRKASGQKNPLNRSETAMLARPGQFAGFSFNACKLI
jgi:hypothetical protein